jgi:hypothetical protein
MPKQASKKTGSKADPSKPIFEPLDVRTSMEGERSLASHRGGGDRVQNNKVPAPNAAEVLITNQDPGQVAQMAAELKKQLDEERALAQLQREEDAIAREKFRLEKEALTRINGHLLKQVQTLRRAEERNSEGMRMPSPSRRPDLSRPGSKVGVPTKTDLNGGGDQPSHHSPVADDLRSYLREKETRARHFKEFEEMMQKRAGEPQPEAANPPVVRSKLAPSPLSAEILTCPFPKKFSPPTFDRYTGKTDPVQHL